MYSDLAMLKKYIANTMKSKQDHTKLVAKFSAIYEHEENQDHQCICRTPLKKQAPSVPFQPTAYSQCFLLQ
jgi:hypothetical protein